MQDQPPFPDYDETDIPLDSDTSYPEMSANNPVSHLRVPPHSIEAEQSVIGGLMLDNEAWYNIADKVTRDDFYRKDHAFIFDAIARLANDQKPFDVLTISDYLEKEGALQKVGGLAYLAQLAKDTPSAANIVAYASVVNERATLRELIKVGTDISSSAYQIEGKDLKGLVDDAERMVFGIAERNNRGSKGYVKVGQTLKPIVERLKELSQSTDAYTGLETGIKEFDKMTSGLQKGDLVIVAGRPSMGKTTLAVNMAEHVAIMQNQPVAVFSMEMASDQLVLRMMASQGRINQGRLRSGKMEPEEWNRVSSALSILKNAPIFIDDTPALSPTDLRARARRIKREHGLGLILVDYLQLMQVKGTTENRTNEISEISRNLKTLARELDVPVIALSQLNRSLEQRQDKKPVMSDLRESGAIEQDADVIVFIYRDEVYNKEPTNPKKGQAEIIIGKQRNGPTGSVIATFKGEISRFENFAPDDYANVFE